MKKLVALPAFADNYIWMLHDGRRAIVVDPGDADAVHLALDAQDLQLAGILVTHHHGDHIGGIDDLRSRLKGEVHGPANEAIPGPFIPLHDGDQVNLLGWKFEVMHVPGHTLGHIAYFHASESGDDAPALFCGDTLFSAGCGRLFEGSPAQMHASLRRLAALPGLTRVCCGHEYTLSNLKFSQVVEPDNDAVRVYTRECERRRAQGLPTLPSTVAQELLVNPFLRCHVPEVQRLAREHGAADSSPGAVFAALRQWKNGFQ